MKKILFILIGVILIAPSCKKHLGKRTARKQITVAGHYPIVADYEFTKGFNKDQNTQGRGVTVVLGEDEFKEEQKMIELFEKDKLVEFKETPHREEVTEWLMGTTVRTWTEVDISLTDEGRKYLLSENEDTYTVRLWETQFDAITGIQEIRQGKDKMASVSYTVSNKKITPFGESFEDKNKVTGKSAFFSLDGGTWRIRQISEE